MNLQRTLKEMVTLEGVGLHSGRMVQLRILPARPNHGITFRRTDIPSSPEISAHYRNVTNTQLSTTLGKGPMAIGTIEHLMAAFQGMQIDNAVVEINGSEVPILDGSSAPFVVAFKDAGIQTQFQPKPIVVLKRRVEVKVAEKWAVAEQTTGSLEIHASVDFDHPSIGYQEYKYVQGITPFSEIASARTFGFLKEVEALKKMGLARGGSLENAVVLDDSAVLNPEGLRHPDEFVRHKVLDALGDLKLAGIHLQARILLHRAGHELHGQLLKAIFSDATNYEIIDPMATEAAIPSGVRSVIARLVATI